MPVASTTSPDDGDALALTFAYPVATKAVSAVEEKRGKPEHIGEILRAAHDADCVWNSYASFSTQSGIVRN